MVFIGIDPAFRKDGFKGCVIDSIAKTVDFIAFEDLFDFYFWMEGREDLQSRRVLVFIENSNLQSVNFDMRGSVAEVARKGRNVGANQAISQLAVQAANMVFGKDNVIGISPKAKGSKLGELQSNALARLFSLEIKTRNQDERDAFKLAALAWAYHNADSKIILNN